MEVGASHKMRGGGDLQLLGTWGSRADEYRSVPDVASLTGM